MICLDEDDVLTYSAYMQTVNIKNVEDTTKFQADLEVDAEVVKVWESIDNYDFSYLFNYFKGWAHKRYH